MKTAAVVGNWINLSDYSGGQKAVLSRLPEKPAVYAWYDSINCKELRRLSHENPHAFVAQILSLTTTKHCSDRRGRIPPLYSVILMSDRELPSSKREALRIACMDLRFREELVSILEYCAEQFQRPLYVGKARLLRTRIGEHLSGRTELRERLEVAGIKLERSRLYFVLPETAAEDTSGESQGDEDERLFLLEDVLSRIYQPSFTLRYG